MDGELDGVEGRGATLAPCDGGERGGLGISPLESSFSLAPHGLVVATPGDPSSVNKDLPHIMESGK